MCPRRIIAVTGLLIAIGSPGGPWGVPCLAAEGWLDPEPARTTTGPTTGPAAPPEKGIPGAGSRAPEGRSRLGPSAEAQPAAALPEVSLPDLVLLVKTARRAFRDKVSGVPERSARYRPPALRGIQGIVSLTLRSDGADRAEVETPEMDVVDAAVAAGTLLGYRALEKKLEMPDGGAGLALEFEFAGPPEYVPAHYGDGGRWSEELLHCFEPAVEGIGVEFGGKRGRAWPSEVVEHNYTPDLMIQSAESDIGLKHAQKVRFAARIRYFRFRTYHLWQSAARSRPVPLVRGTNLVSAESLDAGALDAAVGRLGAYLRYRQNRDGWFSHEYLPSPSRYGQGNSAMVQMQALHGLAAYAAWSRDPGVLAELMKGIEKTGRFLEPLHITPQTTAPAGDAETPAEVGAGLVLWFPGHGDHLGVSARFLCAMKTAMGLRGRAAAGAGGNTEPPGPGQRTLDEWCGGLIDGILACQAPDGHLEMIFQPRPEDRPEAVAAAGCALQAVSLHDPGDEPDGRIESASQRALSYYGKRPDLLARPDAAAAWTRAFARGYVWTNDARASAAVFEILDQFVTFQVTEERSPCKELHGAINLREPGAVGIDTAVFVAALADGLAIAERIGDRERVERYRQAVLAGVRFVLQLEVRAEGCYYMRSPRDALGGVRTALWDNRIRVDHCAEALMALIRAREALYGRPAREAAPGGGRDG